MCKKILVFLYSAVFKKNIIAFLALIISLITLIVLFIDRYQPIKPIITIIKSEAEAVTNKDIDLILKYYENDAVIRDIGEEINNITNKTNNKATWIGINEIKNRYNNLPKFTKLSHDGIKITFSSNKKQAIATANTNASYIDNSGNIQNVFSINGEEWIFEKIKGKWKITCFNYNKL